MASIFDPADKGLTRAPVDEFFAGRNSAMIDDDEWDKAVSQAERILGRERGGKNFKEGVGNALAGYMMTGSVPIKLGKNRNLDATEGSDDDKSIRSAVQDKTGLFMYPGQGIKADPEDVAFMREFDDSGASLAEGWRDGGSLPETLGGLLQHEELYKHYPELANMPLVQETDPDAWGSYGMPSEENPLGIMAVQAGADDAEVLKTLLHEGQHYIQDLEGWPGGGGYGHHTLKNFASEHPERFGQYDQAFRASESEDEAQYYKDEADWESYANISGEILARDVEDRFDKRNELSNAADSLLNPDNPNYYPDRTEENKVSLLSRLEEQNQNLNNTYPYLERTKDNSFPHDMPTYEALQPLLTVAAMGQRESDKHADQSMKYAESLLDEILKQRK